MPPSSTLADFQREFAAALLGEATSPAAQALAAQPGFAVHRNTVLRGCIDALAANYPTIATLVGVEWFEAAAGRFARTNLPRDGSLAAYGEGFAEFLDALEPGSGLAYLGGVARLDRAWTEAHLAADAPVLTATALAALSPARLLDATLVPHPATRWASSPELPIFTIWRRHREQAPLDAELDWHGEGGLLTRPGATVVWRALDAGAAIFLDECAHGRRFGVAVERAFPAEPEFGIATWLPALVAAGSFTRLESPSP
jgi:hypothetical protein